MHYCVYLTQSVVKITENLSLDDKMDNDEESGENGHSSVVAEDDVGELYDCRNWSTWMDVIIKLLIRKVFWRGMCIFFVNYFLLWLNKTGFLFIESVFSSSPIAKEYVMVLRLENTEYSA